MKITQVSKQKFSANPISRLKVKNSENEYKLYEITTKDKLFLSEFTEKLDLKKLMPKMQEDEINIWQDIVSRAIYRATNGYDKTIFETYNDIPCGILNYSDSKKFKINYIATFPDKEEHRVPCAGQVLFYELFNRFLKSEHSIIELNALREGPFSPISAYLKLGFGMCGGSSYIEKMVAKKEKIIKTLEKQKSFITCAPVNNTYNVNLEDECYI